MSQESLTNTASRSQVSSWISPAIVFILFCSMGFPGSYKNVVGGDTLGTAVDYFCFFLEILIMLSSSGKDVMEVKLVDLKPRYAAVYLFLGTIFVVSLIGTSDRGQEVISCIRFCVTGLFALWLCENLSLDELLTKIYHAQIAFVIASLAFPVFFSAYDYRPEHYIGDFIGMGDSKNGIAQILCMGVLMQLVLWKLRSKNNEPVSRFFVIFMAAQIVLIFPTHCTSALLILAIVAFGVILHRDNWKINLGMVCVLASVLFLIIAMTVIPMMEPLLAVIGKDATLTGRIPLWTQLIDVIRETHPMVGFGYGHFWVDDEAVEMVHAGFNDNSFMGSMTSGSHNNLLELWLTTGLVGVLAFFAMLISCFGKIKDLPTEKYLFCLSYMMFYTIAGFTERSWTTFDYKTLFLFLALGIGCQKVVETAQPGTRPSRYEAI